MAQAFNWFKTFSENYINPLLENKKFVAFIMCALLGTGVYTAVDMTGNKLQVGTPVKEVKPEPVAEKLPEFPTLAEPRVIVEKTTEKVLQPIVNCNGGARVMRDHVKEHH